MPSLSDSIAIAMEQAARGRIQQALEDLRQLLPLHPTNAELQQALGLLVLRSGHIDQALFHFERAAGASQPRPEYLSNYATALNIKGRSKEAIEQYRKAIQLSPRFYVAHLGLASALMGINELGGAIESARAAVALAPGRPEGWSNLAVALTRSGRSGEAVASLHEALVQLRDHPLLLSNLVSALNYRPEADPAQVFEEHKRLGRSIQANTAAMYPEFGEPDPDRPLRIGYLSSDFREHAAPSFIAPILASHDRQQYQVYCYSAANAPDATTKRLQKLAQQWADVSRLADDQLEKKIRDDKIDILVELSGYGVGSRVAALARRLAPVQVSYLGYPNTTGLKDVQYRIVDSLLAPDGHEQFSTEMLHRLEGCYACYQPPESAPEPGPPPAARNGFVTFGSFNAAAKISEPVIETWGRILKAAPGSKLVLKNVAFGSAAVRDHFLSRFAAQEIGADRLELLGHSPAGEHLAAYNRVDVALDTFPYGGQATTCEALWMGAPVVTLAGRTEAGRIGATLLTAAGLEEFITPSVDDYIALAQKLAGDTQRLTSLRGSLRAKVKDSPLCDARGFTARLEAAYREMWKAWCTAR